MADGQTPQQTQNQFIKLKLIQAYGQHLSQGQITGKAATIVPKAITALGTALGVPGTANLGTALGVPGTANLGTALGVPVTAVLG